MLGAGLTFFTTSARLKCLLSKDTSERRLFVPKGYMLSAHRKLADPEKAEAYRALARPALEAMGGKIIAASDNIVANFNTAISAALFNSDDNSENVENLMLLMPIRLND